MKKILLPILLISTAVHAQQFNLPIAPGVTQGLTCNSWCKIQNGLVMIQNTAENPAIEITTYGEVATHISQDCVIYNASTDCLNEYNEPSVNPGIVKTTTSYGINAFQSDSKKIHEREIDPETRIILEKKGVIRLNGLLYGRGMDKYSMDMPESNAFTRAFGHSVEWDTFSITIVPMSKFFKILKDNRAEWEPEMKEVNPNFIYPEKIYPLLTKNFIYSANQSVDLMRDVVKRAIRNKIHDTKLYNFANVTGPFYNEKDWASDKCEFYDCDIMGAQILSYDANPYGIIRWSDLTHDNKDGIFIVSVQAGDGGADDDDLMGFFIIYKEMFETQKRILYRQVNTRGGVDFILELQLEQ